MCPMLPRLTLLVLVLLPVLRGIHDAQKSVWSADWSRLFSVLLFGVVALSLVGQALYPGQHAAPFFRVGLVGMVAYAMSHQRQRLQSSRLIVGGGL